MTRGPSILRLLVVLTITLAVMAGGSGALADGDKAWYPRASPMSSSPNDSCWDTASPDWAQLEGRAQARSAFHDLRDLAPAGLAPAVLRRQMDDWAFADARSTLRLAGRIATRLAALPPGTPGLTRYWTRYEGATTVQDLERLGQSIEADQATST